MQFRFFLADFFFFNSVFCERSEVSLCVSGMARTQQEMISVCWQSLQALLAESVHLLCMLRGPWGPLLSVSSLVWVLLDWSTRWPRRRWLAVDFLDHHICTVVKVLVILLTYPKDAVFNE